MLRVNSDTAFLSSYLQSSCNLEYFIYAIQISKDVAGERFRDNANPQQKWKRRKLQGLCVTIVPGNDILFGCLCIYGGRRLAVFADHQRTQLLFAHVGLVGHRFAQAR